MYLCYNKPAAFNFGGWQKEALPLGNGSIGAKIFGGVQCELIQFNESSLFSGSKDIFGSYQAFGEIYLNFNEELPYSDNSYIRDLDYETASAMVAFKKSGEGHNRHYFINREYNVFVGRIENTGENLLDFTVTLQSEQNGEVVYENGFAYLSGSVNANNGIGNDKGEDANDLKYGYVLKVIPEEGQITADENGITVNDCFRAVIIMSCKTDFDGCGNPLEKAKENVEKASKLSFNKIFKSHVADCRKYIGKSQINIGQVENNATVDFLLKHYSKFRTDIEALLFDMGRYIVFSSLGGVLPMNESGIWNSVNHPNGGGIGFDNTQKSNEMKQVAYFMGMSELAKTINDIRPSKAQRVNAFGYEEGNTEKNIPQRKSFISKIVKQNSSSDAFYTIKRAYNAVCDGNSQKAYKAIKEFVSGFIYNNLFCEDLYAVIAYTATVYSMLIQRSKNYTEILPCLPEEWSVGSFEDVFCGDYLLSFEWSGGKFKKGKVTALNDGECALNYKGKYIGVSDTDSNDIETKFEDKVVSFKIKKGETYLIW